MNRSLYLSQFGNRKLRLSRILEEMQRLIANQWPSKESKTAISDMVTCLDRLHTGMKTNQPNDLFSSRV